MKEVEKKPKAQDEEEMAIDRGAREKFLSLFAHELKTPLTPLSMQAHVIRRILKKYLDASDPTQPSVSMSRDDLMTLERMLDISDLQIRRISDFVSKLLEFSRLDAPEVPPLQRSEVSLGELTREAVERLRPWLEETQVEARLKVDISARGHWDPFRLDQLITNLLLNVGNFAPGKPVDITVRSDANQAILEISDLGGGIAREDEDKVFSRFFRGSNALKSRGLGLGLHLSRELARLHGGTLSFRNEPGRGVTFVLSLPLQTP